MIKYRKGDLLSVTSGVILHGCNAQGVMGSGIALAIKKRFPEAYMTYRDNYDNVPGGLQLGSIIWHHVPSKMLWIANAITQENYGRLNKRYVNYAAIVSVFKDCVGFAYTQQCSLNFPKIGAGLGGGDWSIIEQLIDDCDPYNRVSKICWEL